MSYASPEIPVLINPIGVDRVIESFKETLLALSWLDYSFGRAWEFKSLDAEKKEIVIPKCYDGNGEYIDVLPNDHLTDHSFIACVSEERWIDFKWGQINHKERDLRLIFWFNLKEIDSQKDYIFTEELKNEVEKLLKKNIYLRTINNYYDEKVAEVFAGYTLNEVKNQYLMYPYSAMRFDITVGYAEEC